MKVKKLYSLLIKNEDGTYYRMKVDGKYYNTLAQIDAYTSVSNIENQFFKKISDKYKLKIVDAFIVYKKDGQIKTIKPIYGDMEELGLIAKSFGNINELDLSNDENYKDFPMACLKVRMLASKIMDSYSDDPFVQKVFNENASFVVKEALKENSKNKLIRCLCKYRELRKAQILYLYALKGEVASINPSTTNNIHDNDIKPIEARRLELVNEEIAKISINGGDEQTLGNLYEEKEILEENLNYANKQVKGQIRMF